MRIIDDKLAGTKWYFYLNPMVYQIHREVVRAIRSHANGKTIDLGAGKLTYRDTLTRNGREIQYTSLDIEKCHEGIDVIADVTEGTGLPDGAFDTVFCSQVLEHVREPEAFLQEAFRLTRSGGCLIATVPFLFYLHGLPNDFRRFTPQGLSALAETTGFCTVESRGVGGLISFVSTILFAGLFHALRFLPTAMLMPLFFCVRLAAGLDRILNTSGWLPASVLLVAKKE